MTVGDTYILDEKQGKSLNRIDTKTNWEAVNPVLAIGEMGIEKDGLLQNIKVGDGVTPWNSLQYMFKSCPYEVGDILVTMNATDPAVRWPGTTWEVFAPGRVLIGAGKGTDVNGTSMEFKVGTTGGEYSHQLTVGEMPSHSHSLVDDATDHGATNETDECVVMIRHRLRTGWNDTRYVRTTGSDVKHPQVPAYFSAYFYKRIS